MKLKDKISWLMGRKPHEREFLARAFVAKAVYRLPTTRDLHHALQGTKNLRRICGFTGPGDVPSESTFSRAFAKFAASGLVTRTHDALVKDYLAGEMIGHISRDSTAIVGREKPAKMDAAYDAKRIAETSREFGHVPITDKNGRGKEVIPMAPHEAERYKMRSSAERANSRLKEDFGANNVMVKGHDKVTQHLMFGVVALFADQLLRLLG